MRTAAESAVVAVRRGRFNEAREAIAFLSGRRLRMEGSGETRTVRAGSRPADQTCAAVTKAAYTVVSDMAMNAALVTCMAKKLQGCFACPFASAAETLFDPPPQGAPGRPRAADGFGVAALSPRSAVRQRHLRPRAGQIRAGHYVEPGLVDLHDLDRHA